MGQFGAAVITVALCARGRGFDLRTGQMDFQLKTCICLGSGRFLCVTCIQILYCVDSKHSFDLFLLRMKQI